MTEGIIQKVFSMDKFAPMTPEQHRLVNGLKKELIARIKKNSHWMYPKYSNGRHDFVSLTAFELIGDMDK